MLSARYLANLSDDLVELYGQLEYEINKDIFRRLDKLKGITDATTYQMEILSQVGGLKGDLTKILNQYDVQARKELNKLYNEAMLKAVKSDVRHYPTANRELSKEQTQVINSTIDRLLEPDRINKTYAAQSRKFEEVYSNLTRMTATVADAEQKKFIKAANNAYMKVSTGAFSWDRAYKDAVKELAAKGVTTVTYTGSGQPREYKIETAVKMNILTGINQTASEQTLEVASDLGTDLVEVSAHIGARPEHEEFQGKVYCLNGERDFIDADGIKRHAEDFYKVCKLGEANGICGINCRHSFYPYFEGTPLEYSNGELSEMADKRVTLDGKQITPYEAEQELRLCERNIRQYKSELSGLEKVGKDDPDYIKAANNLYNWQKKAQHISNETGIKRKYINEYVGTKDGTQPRGLKPKEVIKSVFTPDNTKKSNIEPINYSVLIDNEKSSLRKFIETKSSIKSLDYGQYIKIPSEKDIISKLSGGDKTRGSCSSLAFAFTSNIGGFDVTDYRGGQSRLMFASWSHIKEIANLNGVKSTIVKDFNDLNAVNNILSNITEHNKYYYLATGRHAAIIKKQTDGFYYLEMQSNRENGFKKLNDIVLRQRFGCKMSHTSYGINYEASTILIDSESLAKNKEFVELMKYLNTNTNEQKKGANGSIK